MIDAVAAEWWKLRSVRSTRWTLSVAGGFVLVLMLIAVQEARVWDGLSAQERGDLPLRPLQLMGPWVASLCLAVLGVLSVTSEYRSGTIGTSLAAVPRRGRLVAAKAVVVAAVGLAAGEAVAFASCLGPRLVIGGRSFVDQDGSVCHDLPAFAVEGASVAVFALLGLALGLLTRSAAGAITAVVLLWHVLPLLVFHLPAPWDARVGSVMLSGLASEVSGLGAGDSIYGDLLPVPVAVAVMLAYALVPLALAAFAFTRRDA
ncbi:ABC transporter permease subunit [Actinomadura terrae]|uniref:ABC transporter permease subunit n=1 Tax=Actinomadura terrae TaxID=604353 RepID=UPI001FA758B0|nr:ABC transporter permease subunit [Actinomadura terrae]